MVSIESSTAKRVFPERTATWASPTLWMILVLYFGWTLLRFMNGDMDLLRLVLAWAAFLAIYFVIARLADRTPVASIDDEELVTHRTQYIPTRTWRFRLDDIEKIEVHGPKGRRRWRVHLKDASKVEIPPIGNPWLDAELVRFMQRDVGAAVPVEVKVPPSLFAEIRGDQE